MVSEYIAEYIIYLWFIGGGLLIAAEAFAAPGLGFFFSGLAAISVGLIISIGILDPYNYAFQMICFFAFTAAWAVALWKPFYKAKKYKKTEDIQDMIGNTAVVIGGSLTKGNKGKVKWSGTTMSARLGENSDIEEIPEGKEVTIEKVKGNVLIVQPKS